MVQRGTVMQIRQNRFVPAALALVVIAVAAIAYRSDEELSSGRLTEREGPAVTTPADGSATATASGGPTGSPLAGTPGVAAPLIPGLPGGPAIKPCTPQKVKATGVTGNAITIGQIVTDSNQVPQQLRPAKEGLEAFVKVFNKAGGLCKRKLQIEYRNDNMNPATHNQDARDLAARVLAYVGNESLLDFLDYERQPPFEPTVSGGGGKVPDVGGLAFGYGRSQSRWHAGVIGSVSPTLVGGGQYKDLMKELRAKKTPCIKAGVVYLREPTGASEDQARLGQVSLEESWGAGIGRGKTQLYAANLLDPVPAYEALVDRMIADGMNCAFNYTDLQSSINMAQAMNNRGIWPPDSCERGNQCFRASSVVLSVYDRKFIQDAGEGAKSVTTFIPHIPIVETNNAAMRFYLDSLKGIPGARPSTFSILAFASGLMFVDALQACPQAPTRACLMTALRKMSNFTASGLLGGTSPFRTTRATLEPYGTHNWKWIFSRYVMMRVLDRNGKRDFYRIGPSGFAEGALHVARGRPG